MDVRQTTNPSFATLISRTENKLFDRELNLAAASCGLALESLKNMNNHTAKDYRTVANLYRRIAVKHFNNNHDKLAVENYEKAIQSIISIEKFTNLIDEDYRNLARSFIDLSDALLHMFNHESAATAFANATKAFDLIKSKTTDELKASAANDNYVSFRNLYEKDLCEEGYLKSRKFNNNEKILYQQHEQQQVEKMLDNMFVSPEVKDEKNLYDMMEGLTFTSHSFFSPSNTHKEVSDDSYRDMGRQLLQLAKNQYSQQLADDAIKTLEQAKSAFQQVQNKNESDKHEIDGIDRNIEQLRQEQSALNRLRYY